ncbi:MAG: hypothetical protein RLZZ373_2661 [Pseudomonadota bacterium]|jgi:hypothetical protein
MTPRQSECLGTIRRWIRAFDEAPEQAATVAWLWPGADDGLCLVVPKGG